MVVIGDGRCDSPGHSATYGTYTMMDSKESLVLAMNVVKKTEVKNSYWMELEGFRRCMSDLEVSRVISYFWIMLQLFVVICHFI